MYFCVMRVWGVWQLVWRPAKAHTITNMMLMALTNSS